MATSGLIHPKESCKVKTQEIQRHRKHDIQICTNYIQISNIIKCQLKATWSLLLHSKIIHDPSTRWLLQKWAPWAQACVGDQNLFKELAARTAWFGNTLGNKHMQTANPPSRIEACHHLVSTDSLDCRRASFCIPPGPKIIAMDSMHVASRVFTANLDIPSPHAMCPACPVRHTFCILATIRIAMGPTFLPCPCLCPGRTMDWEHCKCEGKKLAKGFYSR